MGLATRWAAIMILALLAVSPGWGDDFTWTGPAAGGIWQDNNWNLDTQTGPLGSYSSIPTASVYIGPGNVVTIGGSPNNTWAAAGTLTIASGSQLVVPGESAPPYFQVGSSLVNGGDVLLGTPSGGAILQTGASIGYGSYQGATIDGGGTITLTNGSELTLPNYGIGTNSVELINQTVRGDGLIAETNLVIDAPSKIDANHTGLRLLMDSQAGNSVVTNNGIMQASNGGTLQLGSSHWAGGPITITQGTGGVIQALDGSTVLLGYTNNDYGDSGSITGGTLTSQGTGHLDAWDGFLLDGVTNSGDLRVQGAACCGGTVGLQLTNTINNTGTISLVGGDVTIVGTNGATLTGGGTVTLGGHTISAAPLTNVDNKIQGSGMFWNLGTLNNQGLIDSNQSRGNLTVAGMVVTNSGSMQASNGGTLQFGWGNSAITITQTGSGVIQALDGSTVQLGVGGGTSVTGGTLKQVGTGQLVAYGTSLQNLSVSGTLTLDFDNTLAGSINNSGVMDVASAGRNLTFSDGTSLTGGGTMKLDGVNVDGIGPANVANVTSDNVIRGSGNIGWSGWVNLTNNGTVYADTSGTSITFETGSTLSNQGTVQVAQGAGLSVTGLTNYAESTHTLTGGTYNVAGNLAIYTPGVWNGPYYTPAWGATINNNAATIVLDGPSSSMIAGGSDALGGFANNLAGGSFSIINGRNLTTAGAFTNAGAMNVGVGSTFQVGPSGSLGTYTQTGGTTKVNGTLIAGTLNIAGGTLSGAGTLNAGLLVGGTLSPGNSPGTITVNGSYTQTGTLNIEAAMGLADEVIVNGNVTLGGTLDITPYGTWSGSADQDFLILSWTGSKSGDFAQIVLPGLNGAWDGYQFSTDWEANGLYLDVTGNGPASGTTPEPATFLLIGAGLLLGGYKLRRSR